MNVRYLLDADLPRALFHGLVRRTAVIDVLRVQTVGLGSAADPEILAFAAMEGRITVSRDKSTMLGYAAERVTQAESMPGLLLVRPNFARRHGLRTDKKIIQEMSGNSRIRTVDPIDFIRDETWNTENNE